MNASRLEPRHTRRPKLKKPERILREIYKEIEEERAGKGRWNKKKDSVDKPFLFCSCLDFDGEGNAASAHHDGILTKADEMYVGFA